MSPSIYVNKVLRTNGVKLKLTRISLNLRTYKTWFQSNSTYSKANIKILKNKKIAGLFPTNKANNKSKIRLKGTNLATNDLRKQYNS